jgi:hypothetical protein
MVLFHYVLVESDGKYIRYVCSGIEDLALPSRSSRGPGIAGRRGCIEHDYIKDVRFV